MISRRLTAAALFIAPLLFGAAPTAAQVAQPLTVLTFNTYDDAWSGIDEIAGEIRASGASVVALQETRNPATARLGASLGWYYTHSASDVNLLSRQPIDRTWYHTTPSGTGIAGVLVEGVWIYSVRLDHQDYGPTPPASTTHRSPRSWRASRNAAPRPPTSWMPSRTRRRAS